MCSQGVGSLHHECKCWANSFQCTYKHGMDIQWTPSRRVVGTCLSYIMACVVPTYLGVLGVIIVDFVPWVDINLHVVVMWGLLVNMGITIVFHVIIIVYEVGRVVGSLYTHWSKVWSLSWCCKYSFTLTLGFRVEAEKEEGMVLFVLH
mgnify:CR=1 FL=1